MVKIIASDLDGTLLYNGQLSENNYKAVKQLQDNGIKFVVASGRNISEVKMVNFRDIVCPKVLINGGVVVDENYNIISTTYLDNEQLKILLEDFIIKKDFMSKDDLDGIAMDYLSNMKLIKNLI